MTIILSTKKNSISVWFDMNFAALANNCNLPFKDLLIHSDAELIITVSGEVSVLHKNSHLVVKEVLP